MSYTDSLYLGNVINTVSATVIDLPPTYGVHNNYPKIDGDFIPPPAYVAPPPAYSTNNQNAQDAQQS